MANLHQVFSGIYDQYVDKIYRFIYLKIGSPDTAEDLTAETFLRGWQAFEEKQTNPGPKIENISAFLYQIARNLVVDYYRQKDKLQTISAEYVTIVDPRTNLEEKAVTNSDLEIVKQAISRMNDDYQNVIIWRYLDDRSIPEVARLLGRSEEATRVLLHRALKNLRSVINKNEA